MRWLLLLRGAGAGVQAQRCGAQAQLSCGMGNLPGPGIKPMSPALEGEFLTTGPARKSSPFNFLIGVFRPLTFNGIINRIEFILFIMCFLFVPLLLFN